MGRSPLDRAAWLAGARGALAALALVATAARADGAAPDRPLGVGTPGTFRSLFLDMPLSDARAERAPALELRWWMANDWSVPTALSRDGRIVDVRTDEQADVLAASIALPWGALLPGAARLSTTVEARLTEHWGGWSDRPIEAWHRLIGSTDFERERFSRAGVHVLLAERGGEGAVALGGPRLAPGDLVLRTQLRLLGPGDGAERGARERWALALRLDVKAPTGSLAQLGGSGGWDAGAGLGATAAFTPWLTGHALLHARRVSGIPGLPLQPRRWQGGLDASLVVSLPRSGVALLIEDRASSPLFEGGWRSMDLGYSQADTAAPATLSWTNQISGGVRWRSLTAWVSEDFTPAWHGAFYSTNAPDLVLGIAWAGRAW